MKLTKKQVAALREVLRSAEWAQDFIARQDVVVARAGRRTDDTLAYIPNGSSAPEMYQFTSLIPITKDIGSPLCGLPTAINTLAQFIVHNS